MRHLSVFSAMGKWERLQKESMNFTTTPVPWWFYLKNNNINPSILINYIPGTKTSIKRPKINTHIYLYETTPQTAFRNA